MGSPKKTTTIFNAPSAGCKRFPADFLPAIDCLPMKNNRAFWKLLVSFPFFLPVKAAAQLTGLPVLHIDSANCYINDNFKAAQWGNAGLPNGYGWGTSMGPWLGTSTATLQPAYNNGSVATLSGSPISYSVLQARAGNYNNDLGQINLKNLYQSGNSAASYAPFSESQVQSYLQLPTLPSVGKMVIMLTQPYGSSSLGVSIEKRLPDGSWSEVASLGYPGYDKYVSLDTLPGNGIVTENPVTLRMRSSSYNSSASSGYGPMIGALLVQKYLSNDDNGPYHPYIPFRLLSNYLDSANKLVTRFTEAQWLDIVPTQAPRSLQFSPANPNPDVTDWVWDPGSPNQIKDLKGVLFPNLSYPVGYFSTKVMTGKTVQVPYNNTPFGPTFVKGQIDFYKLDYLSSVLPILSAAYQVTGNELYARYVALALDSIANTVPDYFMTVAWNINRVVGLDSLPYYKTTSQFLQRASDHNGLSSELDDGPIVAFDQIIDSRALKTLSAQKGYDVSKHIAQDYFLNIANWLKDQPSMESHVSSNLSGHIGNMIRVAMVCTDNDTASRTGIMDFVDRYYSIITSRNFKRDGMYPESFSYHEGYAGTNYTSATLVADFFTVFPPGSTLMGAIAARSATRMAFLKTSTLVQDSVAFPNGDLAPFNDTRAGYSEARDSTKSYLLPAYQHGMLGGGYGNKQLQVNMTAIDKANHIGNGMLGMTLFANGKEQIGNIRYSRIPGRDFTNSTLAMNLVTVDEDQTQYYTLNRQVYGNVGHVFNGGYFSLFEPDLDSVSVAETYCDKIAPGLVSRYQRFHLLNNADTARPYLIDAFVVKGGTKHDYVLNGTTQFGQGAASSLPLAKINKTYPLLPSGAAYTDPVYESDVRNWYGAFRDASAAKSPGKWDVTFKDSTGPSGVKIFGIDDATPTINVCRSPYPYRRDADPSLYAFWRPSIVERRVGATSSSKSVFLHVIEPFGNASAIDSIAPLTLDTTSDEFVGIAIYMNNGRKDVVLINLNNEFVTGAYPIQTFGTKDKKYSLTGKAGLFSTLNGVTKGYLVQGTQLTFNGKQLKVSDSVYAGTITSVLRKAAGDGYDALVTDVLIPEGDSLKGEWVSLRFGQYTVVSPTDSIKYQNNMNELFKIDGVRSVNGKTYILMASDPQLSISGNKTTELMRPQRTFNGPTGFRIVKSMAKVLEGGKIYQTLTFDAIPRKSISDTDFTPSCKASSGLSVAFASSNNAVASIVNGKIHITGIGMATITASQPGNADYYAAANVARTITVSPFAGDTLQVSTATALQDALNYARPGNVIVMADGVYSGKFVIPATANGDACNPIVLWGTQNAVLDAGTMTTGYVLYLQGCYWQLRNFVIRNGLKGLMCDYASYNVIDSISVHDIGTEGIHFRRFSSHNILKNSTVYNTGTVTPDYGEGVYIGSAVSNWGTYTNYLPDNCDSNVLSNNIIGPNVSAECVDIKEGTTGGSVYGNTFNATGISGLHFADSWIDAKGNNYRIEGNTGFNPTGSPFLHGFQTHVAASGWGNNNVFKNNTAVVNAPGYGFEINQSGSAGTATGNKVYSNNKVVGAASGAANVALVN